MKNLILSDVYTFDNTGLNNGTHVAVNTLTECVYVASKTEVSQYSTTEKQSLNFVSLCAHGYLDNKDAGYIIGIDHLPDQESVCIATSKGDVLLWQPELNSLENVGSVDSGFTCVGWSPDQELVVLTTGDDTLLLMTNDFDALCEHSLHTEQFGEAEQVNVGWGKKETQFHGSEGKDAAKVKKPDKSSPALLWDDHRIEITWRGDGQLFAISSLNKENGCRYFRIYDREGKLQATNELIEAMEHAICWRPSGNLIACSQQKPSKHDIIFFEKNGLQHGEFTLPFKKQEKVITSIMWNSTSDILTVVCKGYEENRNKHTIQLWTTGNYHWYLKQEMHFDCEPSKKPCVLWDTENPYKLHVLLPDGCYHQYMYIYDVIQSRGDDNLSMVAVIDGANLLLTPFKLMVLPPPMATHTITLPSPVQQVSFGSGVTSHNVIIQLSDKQFHHIKYDAEKKSYGDNMLWSDSLQELQLRHLLFVREHRLLGIYTTDGEDYIAFLRITNERVELTFSMKLELKSNDRVSKLFKSDNLPAVAYLYTSSGTLYSVDDSKEDEPVISTDECLFLPLLSSHVAVRNILGKNYVFGLTSHYRLQMNEHEIARDCTSFFLHDEFLLLTTHAHSLRCVYLNSLVQNPDSLASFTYDEAVRRVERGSRIVTAVRDGTAVILQMPRGNLECIHPRALIVSHLQKLLTSLRYREAVETMRRNRINLNLLYDHDHQLFLRNTMKFIDDVNSANRINLFLADISSEDVCTTLYFPFYHHGEEKEKSSRVKSPTNKVDIICKAVRDAVLQHPNKEKFLLCLLTTYVKQSTPDLESVLLHIKRMKDNPQNNDGDVDKGALSYEKALSYILYLVDVNQLFDIALGLYDFDIVLMVAEKSQKDPKEYLPFLNNFKNMEENYQRYSIDKHLKRYTKALSHLTKCEGRFNECLEFTIEHKLYKEAMRLYDKSTNDYKRISLEYGNYLRKGKMYEEAAIVFSRCSYHEEALDSYTHTRNWSMVFREAKLVGYTSDQFIALSRSFSEKLKSHHMFDEAARLLETYAKDIEESVVCLLQGGLWFKALHVIEKYDREDLTETNLKPSIIENYEQLIEKLSDMKTNFTKHTNRLSIVVEQKKQEDLEILEGVRDDPNNDLYSDTTSITEQSAVSASSKGSRSTGHSRKSKSKSERRKYSLRQGSKHEDFALREALAEIVTGVDKMKEEVSSLLKILAFYYYEDKATKLQSLFDEMLVLFEQSKHEIWITETVNPVDASFEFGPGATVQQILQNKNNTQTNSLLQVKKSELPEPTQPTMRSNVKWKLNILQS